MNFLPVSGEREREKEGLQYTVGCHFVIEDVRENAAKQRLLTAVLCWGDQGRLLQKGCLGNTTNAASPVDSRERAL